MRSTFLLGLLLIAAWGPPLHAAAQSATGSGRITGMTFRQGSDAPVADAQITLTPVVAAATPPAAGAPAPAPRTAISGRDGRFVFDGVTPGDYTVRAQREGYFSSDDTGGGPAVTAATARATIVAGQTGEVRLAFTLGGAISGRVQNANGRPAIGTQVQAFRLGYQADGAPLLQQIGNGAADDRGEYRLYHLPPGAYYLAVNSNAGNSNFISISGGEIIRSVAAGAGARTLYPSALDIGEARPLNLGSGGEIEGANIDVRSASFAKISGRVSSTLPISAYDPPPPAAPSATVNLAAADSPAVLAALAALEQLREQRRQAGTATAANTPLPTVQLQLVPRDRRALQDAGAGRSATAALAAPNDGRFEMPNVPPGSYVLYARLPDNTGGGAGPAAGITAAAQAFGRANVDVGTTDVSDIAITVHHGVDVTGRVYTNGDPAVLAGMKISLQPDDSAGRIALYQQVGRYEAAVGKDGEFTIPILPEAVYRVQVKFANSASVTAGRSAPFLAAVRQEDNDVFDSGFAVGDGPVAPIAVFVSVESGSVTGTVLDAEERPVPNAVVALTPPPEQRHNPASHRTVSADADGKFTITGVPPGKFKLFAWPKIPAGADRNAAFMARYENSGLPVTVMVGGEVRADVALSAAEPGQ